MDSGDGVTHVVPVVDGYAFPHLTKRLNVAGRHVTSYLIDLLQRRGYAFNRSADMDTVRQIKEALCYVSYDYQRDLQLGRETTHLMKSYTLPDGRVIKLGPERFMAPEAMFSPDLIDVEGGGIADVLFKCVQEMDIDNRMVRARARGPRVRGARAACAVRDVGALRRQCMSTSCCRAAPPCTRACRRAWRRRCGGCTCSTCSRRAAARRARAASRLPGAHSACTCRVVRPPQGNEEGMKKLKLKIEDPPRRKHMVFLGAAVLADIMKDKPEFWISKHEWEEEGTRVLTRKCGGGV